MDLEAVYFISQVVAAVAIVASLEKPHYEMERAETFMVGVYVQRMLRLVEAMHYQYRKGQIDETIWQSQIRALESWKSTLAVRQLWNARSDMFSEEFQDFFNSIQAAGYREIEQPADHHSEASDQSDPAVGSQ